MSYCSKATVAIIRSWILFRRSGPLRVYICSLGSAEPEASGFLLNMDEVRLVWNPGTTGGYIQEGTAPLHTFSKLSEKLICFLFSPVCRYLIAFALCIPNPPFLTAKVSIYWI